MNKGTSMKNATREAKVVEPVFEVSSFFRV